MSSTTSFEIKRFKNHSGAISWRLSGWLSGVRIRKNFKTREEAIAEKAVLEIRALQAASGLRSGATYLSDAQLREAEDAFRRLAGHPRSLLFYVDYGLNNYREPIFERDAAEVGDNRIRLVCDRVLSGGIESPSSFRSMRYVLTSFVSLARFNSSALSAVIT